ncbi:uncharacterized protein LOC135370770 [Ornithodoros turicata]|uniref:uncharacterized protein LOC135370770 n=1 Tax=Ornithodoros turicata TaxID=34597 RepID=UPI0031390C59
MSNESMLESEAAAALLNLHSAFLCAPHVATTEEKEVQVDISSAPQVKFRLSQILTSDADLNSFTGVESMGLLNAIVKAVEKHDKMNTELSVRDRVLIILVKVRTGLSFSCISKLFQVSPTSVHRYFYGTLPVLSAVLKSAIPWPSKDEIVKNMPKCFEDYKRVRIVLDGTEVEVEKSTCLACRIQTYSNYKRKNTVKYMIGVSPAGLITFVSNAFGGRASDGAIVELSNVIDLLEPYDDHVMVDKGFRIDNVCSARGVSIVQPPFLRQQSQLSAGDSIRTAKIARARVHVERAIQRIKIFKLLRGPIEWEMLSVIDDIITVVAGLVNLSRPILNEDKFM